VKRHTRTRNPDDQASVCVCVRAQRYDAVTLLWEGSKVHFACKPIEGVGPIDTRSGSRSPPPQKGGLASQLANISSQPLATYPMTLGGLRRGGPGGGWPRLSAGANLKSPTLRPRPCRDRACLVHPLADRSTSKNRRRSEPGTRFVPLSSRSHSVRSQRKLSARDLEPQFHWCCSADSEDP
jgi:hypothetical protein